MKQIALSSLEPQIVSAIELAKIIKSERIKNVELKQRRVNSMYFTIQNGSILDRIEYDFIQPETSIYSGVLRCKNYGVDTIVTVEEGFSYLNKEDKETCSLLTPEQIMTGGLGSDNVKRQEVLIFSVTSYTEETMKIYMYPYKIDKLDNVVVWQDSAFAILTDDDPKTTYLNTSMIDSKLAMSIVAANDSLIDSLIGDEDSVQQTLEIISVIKNSDTDDFYNFCRSTEESLVDNDGDQYLIAFERAMGAEIQCL